MAANVMQVRRAQPLAGPAFVGPVLAGAVFAVFGAATGALPPALSATAAASLAPGLAVWLAAGAAVLAMALARLEAGALCAALRRWVLAAAMVAAIHWASRHGFGGLTPGAVAIPLPGPLDGYRTAWRALFPQGRGRTGDRAPRWGRISA